MTPDLMAEGARRRADYEARRAAGEGRTASGGRAAGYGRPVAPDEPDFAQGVALYLDDVTVSFDGFKALNKLSLAVDLGELRCIIGPNGAGKTTMMDCITGKTTPDEGRIFFGSNIDLLRHTEPEIAQLGIGRKFQKPTVYEPLTVFENLELALKADRRARAALFSRLSGTELDRIGEVLQLIHLKDEAQRTAGLLSHGQKQWLEIGMLLMQDPKLLLLDEPVAGMTGGSAFAGRRRARHDLRRPAHPGPQEGHGAARGARARRGPARPGAGRREGGRGLPRPVNPTC